MYSLKFFSLGSKKLWALICLHRPCSLHICKDAPIHSSNTIVKFVDDTTVVGFIRNNDEASYRQVVQHLTEWCADNNLALNTDKTKEVVVDFRRSRKAVQDPLFINTEEVERVDSIKFLGTHITKDLTWTRNTSYLVKRAQQTRFFLRKLKQAGLAPVPTSTH